jgi:hypothetical protein
MYQTQQKFYSPIKWYNKIQHFEGHCSGCLTCLYRLGSE